MTIKTKFTVYLTIAILFFILSGAIFILADGLKRWYSAGFFLIMASVVMAKAVFEYRQAN